MSYSQNQEDLIVKAYFKDYRPNILDVGANDGITFSNSYLMISEDRHNVAFLFEPSSAFNKLVESHKTHSSCLFFNKAITKDDGNYIFWESGSHIKDGSDIALVSTLIASETNKWAVQGVEYKTHRVEGVSFSKWYESERTPPLEFITIDAEGCDWDILQQINLSEVGCKCLCIEWNSQHHLAKLYTDYCAQFGLKEIHRNAENIIYAA